MFDYKQLQSLINTAFQAQNKLMRQSVLSSFDFFNECQVLTMHLPRQVGKTTAIENAFNPGTDLIFCRNNDTRRTMVEGIRTSIHNQLIISHKMLPKWIRTSAIDRFDQDSEKSITVPGLNTQHLLYQFKTTWAKEHDRAGSDLDRPRHVIFMDEIEDDVMMELEPYLRLMFNDLYRWGIPALVVDIRTRRWR